MLKQLRRVSFQTWHYAVSETSFLGAPLSDSGIDCEVIARRLLGSVFSIMWYQRSRWTHKILSLRSLPQDMTYLRDLLDGLWLCCMLWYLTFSLSFVSTTHPHPYIYIRILSLCYFNNIIFEHAVALMYHSLVHLHLYWNLKVFTVSL
jgi:hypothetical protein